MIHLRASEAGLRQRMQAFHSRRVSRAGLFRPLFASLSGWLKRTALIAFGELRGASSGECTLIGAITGAPISREHSLNFHMGPGDDMYANEFAHSAGGGGASIGGGFN